MGLVKCCGLYINLEGISTRIAKLCNCCKKPKKSNQQQQHNDPAAFLVAAAAAKASIRKITSYSRVTSDESVDGRSESSYNQDIKGFPGKKSWKRQAKKWTKRTKKKSSLESKSSSEDPNKFEKCIKKKSRKHKTSNDNTTMIENTGHCSELENNTNEPEGTVDESDIQEESVDKTQKPNLKTVSIKFKNSAFHQSLAKAEVSSLRTQKPFAEVHPMPQVRRARFPNDRNQWDSEFPPGGASGPFQILTSPPRSTSSGKWRSGMNTLVGATSVLKSPLAGKRNFNLTRLSNPSEVPRPCNVMILDEKSDTDENYDNEVFAETIPACSGTIPDDNSSTNPSSDEDESSEEGHPTMMQKVGIAGHSGSPQVVHRVVSTGANNPAHECFGSVVINLQELDHKLVSVGIIELRGLPWVGNVNGLMLEVGVAPKTQWLALPHGHGPRVPVNLKLTIKIPRSIRDVSKPASKRRISKTFSSSEDSLYEADIDQRMIRISVWVVGRVWRYGAIGHALAPLRLSVEQNPKPVVIGLYHQLEPSGDLGSIEVGLEFQFQDSQIMLHVMVLRARNLRPPVPSSMKSFGLSRRHDGHDVWCRVNVWNEGEKFEKAVTPKVVFPVTCDPVFRATCSFAISKEMLQNTCTAVKVVTGRGLSEEVLGKVVLGPLLYLGTTATPSTHPPPVALSHWGKALNHPSQVDMWHKLYA